MIFVSAQPNELLFAWQTEVQLKNFQNLGIDLSKVNVLVGYTGDINSVDLFEKWNRIRKNYPSVNLRFYEDLRESKGYAPSIRPFLLSEFFKDHPDLVDEYMFYYDSDIVLKDIPAFEAMSDFRWHVSPADYIAWNYIEEKKSPSLMRDMHNSVGIDQETTKLRGQDVGGVQYYIYGTTPEFWKKVEQDCERMWRVHHQNHNIYVKEHIENTQNKTLDFQIWCTDMWCIYWNALLNGVDVYANPALNFVWPKDRIEQLEEFDIYHDSGIDTTDNTSFAKGNYKTKTPFNDDLSKLGYYDNGELTAQRFYIDLIEQVSFQSKEIKNFTKADLPLVSCLMTTYGRFECVERSIAFWLLQDYPNKELVILNTAEKPLTLDENLRNKGIRIINTNIQSSTRQPFTNVGQIRNEVLKAALGDYYICWDDDDAYLPFHISKGMNYIFETGKKAYKPESSYWSNDGGLTFTLAQNSMEASIIAKIEDVREAGFDDSNGAEHLSWVEKLKDEKELDEKNTVTPLESYVYIWGDETAPHKQSGNMSDLNNFENHKKQNIDFGVRPLNHYSPIRIKNFFRRIVTHTNNPILTEMMINYV